MVGQAFAPGSLELIRRNQQNTPGAILSNLVSGAAQGFIQEKQAQPQRKAAFTKAAVDFIDKGMTPMVAIQQAKAASGFEGSISNDEFTEELNRLGGIKQQEQQRTQQLSDIELQQKQAGLTKTQAEAQKITSEIEGRDKLKFSERTFEQARDVGKEFRKNPIVKSFDEIQRSVKNMENAFKTAVDPKTKSRIAADQALGVTFQKMLDPDSVVRESEYARTPEGASFINKWTGRIKAVTKGGLALEDSDREELLKSGRLLLQSSAELFNEKFDVFDTIAESQGLPKEVVFGGKNRFDIGSIGQGIDLGETVKVGNNLAGSRSKFKSQIGSSL